MQRRSLLPSLFGGRMPAGQDQDPFAFVQQEMNRLFDDVFRTTGVPAGLGQTEGMLSPSMDVRETEKEIQVHAEIPGVQPEDVDITLDEDILTLRGEKKFEHQEERPNFRVMERSYGSFSRSIRLPFKPEGNSIRADVTNGVLSVTIPKPAERQQRQQKIRVSGAPGGTAQVAGPSSGSGESTSTFQREAAEGGRKERSQKEKA